MTKSVVTAMVLSCFLVQTGCGGGKLSDSKTRGDEPQAKAGTEPPVSGLGSSGPLDDHSLPLKLTGLNSVEELERGMIGGREPKALEAFEVGFRKTFTADATKRDYAGAIVDLEEAVRIEPGYAEAHRALGYARFNQGFNVQGAMEAYQRAIELKPDYGEAHYALAFLYAMNDRDKGADHFWRAMELAIPDERGLAEKYYGDR